MAINGESMVNNRIPKPPFVELKPPVFAEILQKSHFFLQMLAYIKNKPYLCSDFTKQAISLLFNLLQTLAFVG